ncbi:MAG: hypothetical protein E7Z84_04640 [Methanosphaera stadtmanae]|nr:hypothetical protein [Methanosphaera stadtmanae]
MPNPILAAILSLIIPGIGQFYSGDSQKAIMMFVGFIILSVLVSIIFKDWISRIITILYRLYTAYDAYQMAIYQ